VQVCNLAKVPITVDPQVIKVVSLGRKEALLLRIGGNGKRLDLAAKLAPANCRMDIVILQELADSEYIDRTLCIVRIYISRHII
jgi:hypothetical protein